MAEAAALNTYDYKCMGENWRSCQTLGFMSKDATSTLCSYCDINNHSIIRWRIILNSKYSVSVLFLTEMIQQTCRTHHFPAHAVTIFTYFYIHLKKLHLQVPGYHRERQSPRQVPQLQCTSLWPSQNHTRKQAGHVAKHHGMCTYVHNFYIEHIYQFIMKRSSNGVEVLITNALMIPSKHPSKAEGPNKLNLWLQ